jgi:hypothetical protein
MLFNQKLTKHIIISVVIIISITECTNIDRRIFLHFNKNDNLVPVNEITQYSQVTENNNSLILYVEDAECSMCLAELLLWRDLLIRNQSQKIQYYIIFKKSSEVTLQYNLDILGINEKIYWDSKGILEEEIENNSLDNTIFVDKYFQVIKSFDRTLLSEDDIIEIITEFENTHLESE